MKPIAIGTLVDYHGSHAHGRYIVTGQHCAEVLFPRSEWNEIAEYYPDGIAYEIWPENMLHKFGNREYMISRVRRSSLTVVNCTREGFEPMTPFEEEM